MAQIDVLINLDGWTSMGRTNEVFAARVAPVQLMYLGFPGTLAERLSSIGHRRRHAPPLSAIADGMPSALGCTCRYSF